MTFEEWFDRKYPIGDPYNSIEILKRYEIYNSLRECWEASRQNLTVEDI